jgi:hypothetical protein
MPIHNTLNEDPSYTLDEICQMKLDKPVSSMLRDRSHEDERFIKKLVYNLDK